MVVLRARLIQQRESAGRVPDAVVGPSGDPRNERKGVERLADALVVPRSFSLPEALLRRSLRLGQLGKIETGEREPEVVLRREPRVGHARKETRVTVEQIEQLTMAAE